MSGLLAAAADAGALLPPPVMDSGATRVLAAFVAINTVMYGALAVAKILPRLHPSTWFQRSNRRAQERSIFPAGPGACPQAGEEHDPEREHDLELAGQRPGAGRHEPSSTPAAPA